MTAVSAAREGLKVVLLEPGITWAAWRPAVCRAPISERKKSSAATRSNSTGVSAGNTRLARYAQDVALVLRAEGRANRC